MTCLQWTVGAGKGYEIHMALPTTNYNLNLNNRNMLLNRYIM